MRNAVLCEPSLRKLAAPPRVAGSVSTWDFMARQPETAGQRKGSYKAPALDKAFLIIELLANNPQGLLASEMATALGRSLGELFRIVVVLEEAGYLQKSRVTDRYTVTYKFLDVAYRATPARKLVVTAQPEMQALYRKTQLQPPERCVPTFPSWRPQRAIDHMLVTPALAVAAMQALPAAQSDHLALSVELDVPEAALR